MPQTDPTFPPALTAPELRAWLQDGQELALLDVREAGQFGEGHPFFAIPLPYSRLEPEALRLLPRRAVRTVLIDAGDGVAARAAARLQALGFSQLWQLEGGAAAWTAAGYTLFQGVNLPSKTFGEQVEHHFHTPHISAVELQRRQQAGEALVLLDGRTLTEHRKMCIPGAIPLPNGELPVRWQALVPDATTPVVVHCAGRTRSIIGAQILRQLGLPNPVLALENGTQGWALAGLALEHGSTRQPPTTLHADAEARAAAQREAESAGVPRLSAAQAQAWIDDAERTTYVLDVRSADEFAAATLPGAHHAPGGQLLQATDQSIAVRGARVLLLDHEAVRAPVIAAWLARLGHQTATVEGGIHAALRLPSPPAWSAPEGRRLDGSRLAAWLQDQRPVVLDGQPALDHRRQHAAGARWINRARLPRQSADLDRAGALLVLAADPDSARLLAAELQALGHPQVHWALQADWLAAGLPLDSSPDQPADEEAIDHLFFVHDRHDGNLEAARRYLAWETGLLAQCQPDELAAFSLR
ncbi:MAG: sulfurtransferase [Curvibacter sp.]|nr:sulfurtransferase [Curvibacter sp.]